jgi:hypothetical protein
MTTKKRILFTGYAPIHFVCFLPVFLELSKDPRLELFVSGGFKSTDEAGAPTFSLEGFYDQFPIDQKCVIPVERVRAEHFDVLVSAHLSDTLFPKSVGKTVQIFHGVSFKNLAVRDKALRYDLLCLPGKYHAELYRKSGFITDDGARCLLTGFSKIDTLVSGALDRDALLTSLGVSPELPTLLFAPTGEKHNALDTMGVEVVKEISETGKWNLLVKPHDHPKKNIDWFKELAPFESDKVKLIKSKDVIPYLHAADLLITDASSVAVEYTLMDRPIIFLDIPKLFKRLKKRAPNLDLDTYGRKIGSIVGKSDNLVEAISESLANPDREGEIRRKMSSHIFHAPGLATANVLGVVLYAAGLSDELPATVEVLKPGIGD